MLEASIGTIIWFIFKVIIAIGIIFIVGLFTFGFFQMLVERSNGSIFKMLMKVLLVLIVGGVTAFYTVEIVQHYFANGNYPTSGGIVGLLLLAIIALSKVVGSIYTAASIFAFIAWYGIMHYVIVFLFGTKEEIKQLLEEEPIKTNKSNIMSQEEKEIQEGKEALKELRAFGKKNKEAKK